MDQHVNQTNSEPEESHLFDYLMVVAKYRRAIIYTSAAVTILTYLYLVCSPNTYKASARLLPPTQNLTLSASLLESMSGGVSPGKTVPGGGATAGLSSLLGFRTGADLFVAIMSGDTISNRIIESFNLKKIYKVNLFVDARKQLRRNVRIINKKMDMLISIEAIDSDPQRAAAMANAFPDELDKLMQELATQEAKTRLTFFEKERVLASANLIKSEENLRTFSEEKSVIQIDAQTRGMLDYIATLRASIDAKDIQAQVMRQQVTASNYDLIRLETELKALREKLQATETQWDQSCIGDVCLPTSKAPSLGLEYIRLYREVKFQEGLYQLYTKMVEIARLDMAKDVIVIQVVDKATPPERRSNERVPPAILAGMGTFFMMILFVFSYEYWLKIREQESHTLVLIGNYLDLPYYKNKFISIIHRIKYKRYH